MDNQTQPSAQNEPAVVKYQGPKMDADLKTNWVAALRSGEYQQATQVLRDGLSGGMCCLGVLCAVTGAKWDRFTGEINGDWRSYEDVPVAADGTLLSDGEDQELHPLFRDHIGLSEKDHRELIEMNDEGASFAEIADHIEANL